MTAEELRSELSRLIASVDNIAGSSGDLITEEQAEDPKEKPKKFKTSEEFDEYMEKLEAKIDEAWADIDIKGRSK